jgi:hypothetical protein
LVVEVVVEPVHHLHHLNHFQHPPQAWILA